MRKAAPKAEEGLSYGMPFYSLNGRLVYFAAFKNHIGLYPLASGVAAFEAEIAGRYHFAKGSIQFPHDEPLPLALITRIVKHRVKENAAKAAAKKKR